MEDYKCFVSNTESLESLRDNQQLKFNRFTTVHFVLKTWNSEYWYKNSCNLLLTHIWHDTKHYLWLSLVFSSPHYQSLLACKNSVDREEYARPRTLVFGNETFHHLAIISLSRSSRLLYLLIHSMGAFSVPNIGKVLSEVIAKSVAYIFFGLGRWTVWPSSNSRMSFHAISPCYQWASYK